MDSYCTNNINSELWNVKLNVSLVFHLFHLTLVEVGTNHDGLATSTRGKHRPYSGRSTHDALGNRHKQQQNNLFHAEPAMGENSSVKGNVET